MRPRKRRRSSASSTREAAPEAATPPGPAESPEPETAGATDQPQGDDAPPPDAATYLIDLVPDELTLARAQIDAGLPALAEGTLRRRIARLEADGSGATDETDAARTLLAEALWRQQRLLAARAALDAVRPASPQRRLPIATMIEADALAAAGELDRAAGGMERVLSAIGVEEAWSLRAGAPGRLAWPLPGELLPEPPRATRPPWSSRQPSGEPPTDGESEERGAGRVRMEEARVAYVAGDLDRGDTEMSFAVRLDPSLAADGVVIIEPTLGGQPPADRLLLFGDLLRAAGRHAEAQQAYARAARQQGADSTT